MNDSKMSKVRLITTVLVMGACWSICYLIPFIQYVFYDPFQQLLGCSNAQLGFLMTVYGFGNLYGCPIGGWIADRYNYKIVYAGSVLLNGILQPLHNKIWRSGMIPEILTCNLSNEESTKRAVPLLDNSSPKTCQGSIPKRISN